MGHIRHHAIIVTGWCAKIDKLYKDIKKAVEQLQKKKKQDSRNPREQTDVRVAITLPRTSAVNGYRSFAVLPDGSKSGWPDDVIGDEARAVIIGEIEKLGQHVEWVEVSYGRDDNDAKIERHPFNHFNLP